MVFFEQFAELLPAIVMLRLQRRFDVAARHTFRFEQNFAEQAAHLMTAQRTVRVKAPFDGVGVSWLKEIQARFILDGAERFSGNGYAVDQRYAIGL